MFLILKYCIHFCGSSYLFILFEGWEKSSRKDNEDILLRDLSTFSACRALTLMADNPEQQPQVGNILFAIVFFSSATLIFDLSVWIVHRLVWVLQKRY